MTQSCGTWWPRRDDGVGLGLGREPGDFLAQAGGEDGVVEHDENGGADVLGPDEQGGGLGQVLWLDVVLDGGHRLEGGEVSARR